MASFVTSATATAAALDADAGPVFIVGEQGLGATLTAAGFDVSDVRAGHKPGTRVCTVRDAPGAVPALIIEPAPPV